MAESIKYDSLYKLWQIKQLEVVSYLITTEHLKQSLINKDIHFFNDMMLHRFYKNNSVNFSNCKINDELLSYVANALENNPYINEVNLENNEITDMGIKQLIRQLTPKKYKKLFLMYNPTTYNCFKELSKWLLSTDSMQIRIHDEFKNQWHSLELRKVNIIEVNKDEYEELKAFKEKYRNVFIEKSN